MLAGLMILNYRPPTANCLQKEFGPTLLAHRPHWRRAVYTCLLHADHNTCWIPFLKPYGVMNLSCVMVRKYNMSNTIISSHHWFSTILSKRGCLNSEKRQICAATNSATGELFLTRLKQETKWKSRWKMWLSSVKTKHHPTGQSDWGDMRASVILLSYMSPARTVWWFLIDNSTMAQQRVRLHWCVRQLAQEMKCKNTKTG